MSASDCATDAIPSPPRERRNAFIRKEKTNTKARIDDDEDIENNYDDNTSLPKNAFKNKASQPVINVIQVLNSPYTHIGHTIYHNLPHAQDAKEAGNVIETEKMAALKKSTAPVVDEDIDVVKDHIGLGWRNTFRQLGFSDAQIQQSEIKFQNDINEQIRWLLLDWRQANGKAHATVGVLARALWNTNQREALKYWSLQYDDLHKKP